MQVVRNGVASVTNFSLTPIPFFVLMGEVLFHTGVAMKAIDAFDNVIARVPGRLSVIAIVAGTVFSAISGSTIATTALLGEPAAAADAQARLPPEHGDGADHGHRRRRHADPTVGADGAARQPGRHLDHRAADRRRGAGRCCCPLLFVGYIVAALPRSTRRSRPPSSSEPVIGWARWRPLLVYVTPLVAIFVVVVVAMSAGWATPTESAALGALATVAVCVAYRALSWATLLDALRGTAAISGMILFIIIGATTFSQILSLLRRHQRARARWCRARSCRPAACCSA